MVVIFERIEYMPSVENTKFQTLIADLVRPAYGIDVESGVWRLQSSFFMEEESPQSMNCVYIRKCDFELMDLVEEAHNENLPVLLSGTSGCGKTILRNYILRNILMRDFEDQEYERTVILQHGGHNAHLVITIMQTGLEIVPHETIMGAEYVRYTASATVDYSAEPVQLSFALDNKAYYLIDSPEGEYSCIVNFDPSLHKVVIFSTPNIDLEMKYVTKRYARKYFVPMWTLEELLAARAGISTIAAQLTEETVKTRFNQVGGVPRFVLNTTPDWYEMQIARDIPESVEALDIERLLSSLSSVATAAMLPPHSVTHLQVECTATGEYDYRYATPVWGTKFLAKLVAARLAVNLRARLQNERRLNYSETGPSVLGNLVKAYCINQLETSGLRGLQVECTAYDPEFHLSRHAQNGFFGAFPVQYVSSDAEMDAALLYNGPKSRRMIVPTQFNYSAIDAVLVIGQNATRRCLFIQVTFSRPGTTDAVATARFHQMFAMCGGKKRAALACFVPSLAKELFIFLVTAGQTDPYFQVQCIPSYEGEVFKICV